MPTTRRELSFDGIGINGPDQYRSRVATFSTAPPKFANLYGKLFEAAPELRDALLLCVELLDDSKVRHFIGTELGEVSRLHAALNASRAALHGLP